MTDELLKVFAEKLDHPIGPNMKLFLDCGLTLYTLASCIIADTNYCDLCERRAERDQSDTTKITELKERTSGKARALAESYVVNMKWLSNLGVRLRGRKMSHEDAISAWKKLYEWLVKNGIRSAICVTDAADREIPLPFESIHAYVMDAYRSGAVKPTTSNTQP